MQNIHNHYIQHIFCTHGFTAQLAVISHETVSSSLPAGDSRQARDNFPCTQFPINHLFLPLYVLTVFFSSLLSSLPTAAW